MPRPVFPELDLWFAAGTNLRPAVGDHEKQRSSLLCQRKVWSTVADGAGNQIELRSVCVAV